MNFSGGVNISLSLSLKKRNPKNTKKNITQSHTHFCTHTQKSIIMEELKASGNAAFKKGDFASAVDFFTRAIDAATLENHHVLYSNRSAARVRCCCRQKSSSSLSSFCRFDSGESVFFWSSSSSSKSLVVLCVKESRSECVSGVGRVGRFGRF